MTSDQQEKASPCAACARDGVCTLCAILTYEAPLSPEQTAAVQDYWEADDGLTGPTYEAMVAVGLPRWGETRPGSTPAVSSASN